MEILTDVLAIVGFGALGRIFPVLVLLYGGGGKTTTKFQGWVCAFSFALIAASVVLGN